MSTGIIPKNKELQDKENPPHPTLGLKKLHSFEEVPTKKTVLGTAAQICIADV